MRFPFCSALFISVAFFMRAQTKSGLDDVIRIGPGVTPPRVLRKIEPKYSSEARADHVQGTVVFQLVVNEKGRPTDISVISPLGFGLDERAQAAIETWEFAPGMKDGKPVKILATVEVNFRFPEIWFDEKAEKQRTSFNLALQGLKRNEPKIIDHSVKSMQELAGQKFPPAMYIVGTWEITGEHLPANVVDGWSLIQKAAAKNYGPALYEVAIRQLEGRDLPQDSEKGSDTMRQSAMLGSPQAQFYLGDKYEKGDGVPREVDRARRYFRLCATQGIALCQYRLGSLLLDNPDRLERDYVQAVAWFQLAAGQGMAEAQQIATRETANLTPGQSTWVNTLKAQLVRK
jgi:TonB family protein